MTWPEYQKRRSMVGLPNSATSTAASSSTTPLCRRRSTLTLSTRVSCWPVGSGQLQLPCVGAAWLAFLQFFPPGRHVRWVGLVQNGRRRRGGKGGAEGWRQGRGGLAWESLTEETGRPVCKPFRAAIVMCILLLVLLSALSDLPLCPQPLC